MTDRLEAIYQKRENFGRNEKSEIMPLFYM